MRFKPSTKLTLALFALAFVFTRLGFWQLERKAEKQLLMERFENAPMLSIEQALLQQEPFARVEVYGRYDPVRHILLDNQILNGRAGIHVLTPFTLPGGLVLLVNRGWLPMPRDRRSLPEVKTDDSLRILTGLLTKPSAGGPRIGGADVLTKDRWPQLITYFELGAISAALEEPLSPLLLKLDPEDISGFGGRHWTAAVMGPEIHGAYALQWFSLAAATLIVWITLGVRRAQQAANRRNGASSGNGADEAKK